MAVVHERSLGKDSFWHPYFKLLRSNYNNIMSLTEPQMKTLLRRCPHVSHVYVCLVCVCSCLYLCVICSMFMPMC